MLAILLKILSVLGIILLIVLGILLLLLLLVLFLPIIYRLHGEKNSQHLHVSGKISWLFGVLRVKIQYPEPGNMIVKFLGFTLYDSSKAISKETPVVNATVETAEEARGVPDADAEAKTEPAQTDESENEEVVEEEESREQRSSLKEKLFAKYEKIKYTLKKICDKIKHILENITFYKELLQDEKTKGLLFHGWKRLKKILRSIRPRKLQADVLFGTGSPDTTGYLYGIYGMISPHLGKKVVVTPDFTQQIIEGRIDAAGHITIFTLLRHLLAVLFDKRLWLLKQRLDTHRQKMKPKT